MVKLICVVIWHLEKNQKADYVLYINANNPIAVVEAKDNKHSVSHGLQQAIEYAKKLDTPFAYSSNGDGFIEHDFLTGKEREFTLDEFPSPEELISRFKSEKNNNAGITEAEENIIEQPYYTSSKTYPPRYYQRIAVNRTFGCYCKRSRKIIACYGNRYR